MYNRMGPFPIVPIADLQNLVSEANLHGDNRKYATAMGKRAGHKVLALVSAGVYALVVPTSRASFAPWQIVDGSAQYTPVNILNAGGGAAWTLTTATYTGGVLTASGAAANNAVQVVALKKGTYRLNMKVGRRVAGFAPKLVISGATDGVLSTTSYPKATVSADSSVVDDASVQFTLTADQNVTFTANVVDSATLANGVGAAYLANTVLSGLTA